MYTTLETFCVKESKNKGCAVKSGIFKMKYARVCLHAVGQNVVKRKKIITRGLHYDCKSKVLEDAEGTETQTFRKRFKVGYEWAHFAHCD